MGQILNTNGLIKLRFQDFMDDIKTALMLLACHGKAIR